MKKIVFLFLVFGCAKVFAQQPKFLIGLNAAGVWNSYLLTQSKEPFLLGGKINWSTGLQSKYFLGKSFYLDAQVNFSSKNFASGVDYSAFRSIDYEGSLVGQSHYVVKQTFLEIPIAANYVFATPKDVSLFCSLGITNSFSLSASQTERSGISASDSKPFERYKDYLLSVKVGGGMLFPLGKNFYGSADLYSNIYVLKVHDYLGNPFQLALGFSVLKKLGAKKIS